jgi:hypothetical protein
MLTEACSPKHQLRVLLKKTEERCKPVFTDMLTEASTTSSLKRQRKDEFFKDGKDIFKKTEERCVTSLHHKTVKTSLKKRKELLKYSFAPMLHA